MTQAARLIITHGDPDLDAVGFVYSARKVFEPSVPVECRRPTREELEDPAVIVGDIGLPGCEAIGHSAELNNFDHHYSRASRSATYLFNHAYSVLATDLVEYIDQVDTQPDPEAMESMLRVAMAGVLVRYSEDNQKDQAVLSAGATLLACIDETGQKPGDLQATFPPEVKSYLDEGREELRKIREELRHIREDRTAAGRRLGYVVTRSPVFSLVKEELFAQGIDIAVVYNPVKHRYSIAGNLARVRGINLRDGDLVPALNESEGKRGLPAGQCWGGHEDRIGSRASPPPRRRTSCRDAGRSGATQDILPRPESVPHPFALAGRPERRLRSLPPRRRGTSVVPG